MEEIIIFAIVGLLVGFSKGGLGGPVPVALTVPLLSLIMPTQHAVGLVLPLLMFADGFAVYFYWKTWSMKYIKLMLVPGLIGVLIGSFFLVTLDDATLRRIVGSFTLIAIVYKLLSDHLKNVTYRPKDWHGWLVGWASGFGSALANVGAPPFTAYMLLQPKITPRTFIGTTTLFFTIINWTKLPTFLLADVIDSNQLLSIAWVLLIIPLAVWFGRKVIDRINQKTFEWIMTIPLLFLSLWLIFFS